VIKRLIVCLIASLLFSAWAYASSKDDPLLWMVDINRLEVRDVKGDNGLYLGAEAWLGTSLHKVVVKTKAERVSGLTEESEWQLLYSRPIATYWGVQVGLRQDFKPDPARTWGVLTVEGLAPYFIETELSLFVGENGRAAFRLEGKYELPITQKLTLLSEAEVNLLGQNDEVVGAGSGLSETELSLLLSYEVNRKIQPYVGFHWTRKFGKTSRYAREENEDSNDAVFVIGLSAWF